MPVDDLLTNVLAAIPPGRALDLASGSGRHAVWLAQRGWTVVAVDEVPGVLPAPIQVFTANLEKHEFVIEYESWDLIVCWLYWQADLLPKIAAGLRSGGVAAMAGKTTGRFATSLARYREGFLGWRELASGEDNGRSWLIVQKP